MPILQQNIRLRASQVLDDVPEGGGRATAVEIIDGKMNAIYNDWSDTDRVAGRAKLRKVFATVESEDTDQLAGLMVVLSGIPVDPALSYTLFKTPDEASDRRDAARGYVEAYQYRSIEWHGYLFGPHVQGSSMIQIFQRPGSELPQPGQTLCLVVNEGLPSETEQYVQVSRSSGVVRLFYWEPTHSDYEALVVTCELTTRLEHDFPGSPDSRYFRPEPTGTRIRSSQVVDAARYYGTTRLSAPASRGSREIAVDSVMTRLVPAAQTETAVVDMRPGGSTLQTLSGGARSVDIAQVGHSAKIDITDLNIGSTYVLRCWPAPTPGSLVLEYRSQGQRYVVRDEDGTGALTGAGSGFVDFATGNVTLQTLEFTDPNTAILARWASGAHYVRRTQAEVQLPAWSVQLPYPGIVPGTLEIEWQDENDELQTVTDDGNGVLTGAGTGAVQYTLARLFLRPSALPPPGTTPVVRYEASPMKSEDFTPTADGNGFVTVTLSSPAKPRTVVLEFETVRRIENIERSVS